MKKLIICASAACMGLFASCSKEFLVPEGDLPEWLGASIYEELQNPKSLDGTFNTYLRLVDDLGYQEVLSQTGSKTIFPANDEAFARFFEGGKNKFGKSSYDELTVAEKSQLLFGSMLDNAILVGNLSNQQNANGDMLQGRVIKHPSNVSLLMSVQSMFSQNMPENNPYFAEWKNNGRAVNVLYDNTEAPIVHFSEEYMLNNNMTVAGDDNDFYVLTGTNYSDGDAYVFNHKVMTNLRTGQPGNVTCQNGYIHQLDDVLINPGNMAQMLRDNSDTRHLSRMLDYFAVPVPMDDVFNAEYSEYTSLPQDSVFSIRYLSKNSQRKKFNSPKRGVVVSDDKLLDFDPGWNYYNPTLASGTTDNQAEIAAFLAPTDEVLEDYFSHEGAYILKNLGVPGLSFSSADIKNTLDQHLDAVYNSDPSVFATMLNNIMKPYLSKTVPSKFSTVQNDAFEFLNVKSEDVHKVDGKYCVQIANNGVIYKMNKFFGPELYNSVLGPASIYTDMRIMGRMLNDHQITPGVESTLGADMYYYLLSMKANYALFVPTDNDNFIYIDPTSIYDEDGLKALKFVYDPGTSSSFHILIQRGFFDMATNEFTADPQVGPVAIEKGYFNSQIRDMLNYHTVVLDKTKGLNGNHYYLTKHGGAIYVPDGLASNLGTSTVQGGAQIASSTKKSVVTEKFDEHSADAVITNGSVYRLDAPIQPTITSVYKVLESKPRYNDFLEFCSNFSDEDVLYFANILNEDDTDAQKNIKLKNFAIFGGNNVMNLLTTYNYTIYAPADMSEAYQNGLPNWNEVYDIVHNWQNLGYASAEDAGKVVKAKLQKMRDFILYHVQNNSVFDDVTLSTAKNQTFYTNELGIAKTLYLTREGNNVYVNDEVTEGRASKPKILDPNMMARDITVKEKGIGQDINAQTFIYKEIVSSAFVVIHGIDKPLCYNSKYAY